jgi:transmembrane sensor
MQENVIAINQPKLKLQARAWWVRVDSGQMTSQERCEFEAWLNASPLHRQTFEEVNGLWQELDGIKNQLVGLVPPQPTKQQIGMTWRWRYPALAASLLLFFIAHNLTLGWLADERTGIAETRTLHLADGSSVILNSETALSVDISANKRELVLWKGEAQFQVAPDPARPFRVRAGKGVTTALGTAFNIHHSIEATEITVTEHAVSLAMPGNANFVPVRIGNGQQLSYDDDGKLNPVATADIPMTTAWQRGKLIFQDKPLGDVLTELNHYHRGYFVIADPAIGERRVNGVFNTNNPVAALNTIEQSLHFHSKRLSHFLVLLHR